MRLLHSLIYIVSKENLSRRCCCFLLLFQGYHHHLLLLFSVHK